MRNNTQNSEKKLRSSDMTRGGITGSLVLFALPMMASNMMQQLYNIADTLIVGRAVGRDALASVGSAYALMTFITSVFIGLSMGSGAMFSICYGREDGAGLRRAVHHAFARARLGGSARYRAHGTRRAFRRRLRKASAYAYGALHDARPAPLPQGKRRLFGHNPLGGKRAGNTSPTEKT